MFPAAKSLIPLQDTHKDLPEGSNDVDTSWLQSGSYRGPVEKVNLEQASNPRKRVNNNNNSEDETQEKPSKHKKEKKKHKKKRTEDHHESTRHTSSAAKSNRDSAHKPATIWIQETNLSVKDAFRQDKAPDWSNFSYDSLYSGDVTTYQRRFRNYCLGLGDNVLTFSDQRNASKKKSRLDLKQPRYYEEKVCDSRDVALLLSSKEQGTTGDEEILTLKEFLLIDSDSPVNERVPTNDSPEAYLMKRAGEYNTRLLDDSHNIQLWIEFIRFQDEALVWGKLPLTATGTQFDDGTTAHTANESLQRQKLALNERKVAIFERALDKNPLSEELLVGHMELVQETWETGRLVKRWKDIVFKQPNCSLLWLKYMEFCQSRFSFYRSSAIAALYQKAISTLSSILDRSLLSHKPEPDGERKLLVVFLLYCYFLKQSGFVEKAVALFQALIEFNVCSPENMFASQGRGLTKDRLEDFEVFWEGGGARFGEKASTGWKVWLENHNRSNKEEQILGIVDEKDIEILLAESANVLVDNEPSVTDKESEIIKDLPVNVGWTRLEEHREFTAWLPGKLSSVEEGSSDEMEDSDVDHTVLFDDVSQALFLIREPRLKVTLVAEFLRFLGAPISVVPLITSVYPSTIHMTANPLEIINRAKRNTPGATDSTDLYSTVVYQPLSVVTNLTMMANNAFHSLVCQRSTNDSSVNSNSHVSLSPSLKRFVTRVFNQCLFLLDTIPTSPDIKSSLTCSWFQYELSHILVNSNIETAKPAAECLQKLAISLLQCISFNDYTFIWDLVHKLEPFLSSKKKISALSKEFLHPFTVSPSPRGTSLYILCLLFVEYMLKIREPINCYCKHEPSPALALYALVGLSRSEFNPTLLPVTAEIKVSPSEILKASEYFQELSSLAVTQTDLSKVEIVSKLACCYYFSYVSDGLESSCDLMQQLLDRLVANVNHDSCNATKWLSCIEALYILSVNLVRIHSIYHPIKPQIIRDMLCSALGLFPHHPWFLSIFIDSEEQSFNTGQIRRFFNTLTNHSKGSDRDIGTTTSSNVTVPTLFAVRAEIGRHHRLVELAGKEYLEEPLSGLLQRARAFFVRGSQAKIGVSSPALWRCFIKFEMEYGSKERAKAVFYQAIQQCPWVKAIYFDGIQYFPEDGEKIMEIMEEKELRLRTPLEEVKLLLEINDHSDQ